MAVCFYKWIKNKHIIFILFFLFFHLNVFAASNDFSNLQFSAKLLRTWSENGKRHQSEGKMYVGAAGVRTEVERDGQKVGLLYRSDSQTLWMLFYAQGTYMEFKDHPMGRPPLPDEPESPCQIDKNIICKKVTQETVHGRNTWKWDILRQEKEGVVAQATLWIDFALKIAIQEKYADGMSVELLDIQEGPQPTQLFHLPEGLKRLEISSPPPLFFYAFLLESHRYFQSPKTTIKKSH
ncbi:MAG: hypothetical protein H7832_05640 [Magnetococcus sp. DMHC-6]